MGIPVECLDEQSADDFPFLFRLCHSCKLFDESGRSISAYHIEPHVFVRCKHILELVFAEQPVVYEDTCEVASYGLVEQHSRYGRVHSSAQPENHLVVPEPFPQLCDGGVDERCRSPVSLAPADPESEVRKDPASFDCMVHFRMELHCVGVFTFNMVCGIDYICGGCDDLSVFRKPCDSVAV